MPRRRLIPRDRPRPPTPGRIARGGVDDGLRDPAARRVQHERAIERRREPRDHRRVRRRACEHERAVGRLRGHREVERAFRRGEREREGDAGARGGAWGRFARAEMPPFVVIIVAFVEAWRELSR